MAEREDLARALDPQAWDRWGKERGGIGFACFACETQREAAFKKADEIIAPSLAQADEILSSLADHTVMIGSF